MVIMVIMVVRFIRLCVLFGIVLLTRLDSRLIHCGAVRNAALE